MLLFITIFFAILIVGGVTAIAGFSVFLKSRRKSLETNESKQFAEAPAYRSLFEPDEDEIHALETEKKAETLAKESERRRFAAAEKVEKAEVCLNAWRVLPGKSQTVELIKAVAETESSKIFSEIAENVIQNWRNNRAEHLNAADLADLLDSHLRILPQQERTSGAVFWLKEEIKNLRDESE